MVPAVLLAYPEKFFASRQPVKSMTEVNRIRILINRDLDPGFFLFAVNDSSGFRCRVISIQLAFILLSIQLLQKDFICSGNKFGPDNIMLTRITRDVQPFGLFRSYINQAQL